MILLTLAYTLTVLLFILGFLRKNPIPNTDQPFVSVVIAARNEEAHIPNLINDLKQQIYPDFEVIIINDRSTDSTGAILQNAQIDFPQLRIITIEHVEQGISPKKHALMQALTQAQGTIICTTDADCRVGQEWIAGLVAAFDEKTGMVLGFTETLSPVGQTKFNLINHLEAMDYLAMVTSARGVCNLGNAFGASGRNLAYRKAAFEEVGGYRDVMHRLSGDDVLLVQLIRQRTAWQIRFGDDPRSYNRTHAEPSTGKLLSQRIRWASNSTPQIRLNPLFFLFLVEVALVCNVLVWYPILSFWLAGFWIDYLILLIVKVIMDGALCTLGAIRFKQLKTLMIFPLWTILQVPYVVSMGILGLRGRFTWKGTRNR